MSGGVAVGLRQAVDSGMYILQNKFAKRGKKKTGLGPVWGKK